MKNKSLSTVVLECFIYTITIVFIFSFFLFIVYVMATGLDKKLSDRPVPEKISFDVLSSRDHVYNFYRILDDLDNIEPGLSKKFITNVKNDMKNHPNYNPEFILILSFDFSETPEGKDYWKNVGNKLIENLENSNVKN